MSASIISYFNSCFLVRQLGLIWSSLVKSMMIPQQILYKFISCVLNLTCFYIKMSSLTRNCLVPSPTRSNSGPVNFFSEENFGIQFRGFHQSSFWQEGDRTESLADPGIEVEKQQSRIIQSKYSLLSLYHWLIIFFYLYL